MMIAWVKLWHMIVIGVDLHISGSSKALSVRPLHSYSEHEDLEAITPLWDLLSSIVLWTIGKSRCTMVIEINMTSITIVGGKVWVPELYSTIETKMIQMITIGWTRWGWWKERWHIMAWRQTTCKHAKIELHWEKKCIDIEAWIRHINSMPTSPWFIHATLLDYKTHINVCIKQTNESLRKKHIKIRHTFQLRVN